MANPTDETLMAYADGELDPSARAEVEGMLARDPEARCRLQVFLATAAPLADLFGGPMDEPVPPNLIETVMSADMPQAGRERPSIAAALDGLRRALFAGPGWAIAVASAVPILVVAGAIAWHLSGGSPGMTELVALRQGQIFAQGPLERALETAPSGTRIALGGDKSTFAFEAVLTFRNRRQAFCRQYDVAAPSSEYAGVACRGKDGQWRLEIHVAVAPHEPEKDRIAPAGRGMSAVEAAVSNVIEGDALGRQDEVSLIQNKWRL